MSVEPPSHDDESTRSPDGGPGVGNVLGFSLLFRERRALLSLARRSLAPGVRLLEYEALIPGVRMPLRGPLTATKFRQRRCRVVRTAMVFEDRALLPWLSERLVGHELLGFEIREVELDLRRELPEAERPRPCLMLSGHTRAGEAIWLLIAFDVLPRERWLALRPCRLWLIGSLEGIELGRDAHELDAEGRDRSARRMWQALARRLAAGRVAGLHDALREHEGELLVDPARLAMVRTFASVGWKAPNLEGCGVHELSLGRRGLTLELRGPLTELEPGDEGEDERAGEWAALPSLDAAEAIAALPGEPGLLDEPIARGLDRARERMRSGDPDRKSVV